MSDREPTPTPADQPLDGDLRRSDVMCRAEDLRTFLEVLANQITDADKRHSDALRDLHNRLERLGGQTSSMKASLPRPFASAFEQIEEGMAQLAARLTDSERTARRSERASHDYDQYGEPSPQVMSRRDVEEIISETLAAMSHGHPSAHVGHAAPSVKAPLGHHAAEAFADEDHGQAPPALRSAVPAGSATSWSRSAPPSEHAATPEPSPVARPHAGEFVQNPDEPWDDTSAAALSRLYDTEDPGIPPLRSAVVEGVRAPQVLTGHRLPADASPEAPIGFDPSAPVNFDPTWFDTRFADITRRVETSLAALTPEVMTEGLTRRFDQLEERFDLALDNLATRSDVEGLRLVEAQIEELTHHVENATSHLSRLDSIESQISELRHRLSDEEIVRLFGGIVPTEEDLARFAETAAESAADRVSRRVLANMPKGDMFAPAPAPVMMENPAHLEKIASLHNMLSGFVEEQRRGDASTTQALDTLHEAMRVVLDRMEAIEAAQKQSVDTRPSANESWDSRPTHAMADDRNPAHEFSRQEQDESEEYKPPHTQRGLGATADVSGTVATSPAERAKAAARAVAAARRDQVPRREPQDEPAERVEPDFDAPAPRGSVKPEATGRQAGGDRQAFIALARKAAEKAKHDISADADAPSASSGGDAPKKRFSMPALGGSGAASVRPGVWIMASAMFLLLAGYWFIASPRTRVAMPTEVQRAPAAPAATAPGRPNLKIEQEPDGEPAQQPAQPDNAAPDPFQAAPAKPKVGSVVPESDRAMDAPVERSAQRLKPAAAAAVSTSPGSLGISIQESSRQPTPDDVMRVRQKLHLASLSERTAQIAAQTSAVPAALAPADMREHATAADPASSAASAAAPSVPVASQATNLELPPAMIGPLSLRLAAAKGDPSAQFDVAARFAEGKGVPQDFAQAALWYQRAASQGLAPAQYRLATLYERGIGVAADPARARQWYKRAAEGGNLKAMHNLAVMTAARDQGSPDYATAAKLFTDAAERGLADSQYNLAVLLESGLGVERNPIAAYRWYSLAARAGDGESARRRELLKTKLDPQAMAQADAAVAEWRPQLSDRASNDPRAAGEAWKLRASNTAN